MQEDRGPGDGSSEGAGGGEESQSLTELYDEAALFLFRYCGFTSLDQVDQVTIPEYKLLIKSARLREADRDYRNHLQAYLNLRARDKKKVGKKLQYVYTTFDKFYNAEKAEAEAMGEKKGTVRRSLSKAIGDIYRKYREKGNG